jgi:hypothetical protein
VSGGTSERNRNERAASTNYWATPNGEYYTDYSLHGRRAGGTHDTGDTLELQVRLSQAPKTRSMRQAAKELLQEARQSLEQAARSGAAIPARLEEIIMGAGRDHYDKAASQAGHLVDVAHSCLKQEQSRNGGQAPATPAISGQDNQHGGLTGFSSTSGEDQGSNLLSGESQRQLRESALAVPRNLR